MYRLSNRSPPSRPPALNLCRPFNYYKNIQLPGGEFWLCFHTNHSEIATISVMAQSSILLESSFNSKAELGVKIAILLVLSLLWRMHSALYSEKNVVWLVKLVVIMIINDCNSIWGVSRGRWWMFCLCAIERHLQVVHVGRRSGWGWGWGIMPAYLLPKGKALQPHCDAFGCQHRLGKMCFNFGLILPHHT